MGNVSLIVKHLKKREQNCSDRQQPFSEDQKHSGTQS